MTCRYRNEPLAPGASRRADTETCTKGLERLHSWQPRAGSQPGVLRQVSGQTKRPPRPRNTTQQSKGGPAGTPANSQCKRPVPKGPTLHNSGLMTFLKWQNDRQDSLVAGSKGRLRAGVGLGGRLRGGAVPCTPRRSRSASQLQHCAVLFAQGGTWVKLQGISLQFITTA